MLYLYVQGWNDTMDWELENENLNLKDMIIVYEQEIQKLEVENKALNKEVTLLRRLLKYKTNGNQETELNNDEVS